MRKKELGKISVDAGDIVCFSIDEVMKLAERLGVSEYDLIEEFKGVSCQFSCDGNFGVDSMTAVDTDGSTYPIVVIGATDNFSRFLNENEQTFGQFYRGHARYSEVGKGEQFNQEIFDLIVEEYKATLKS